MPNGAAKVRWSSGGGSVRGAGSGGRPKIQDGGRRTRTEGPDIVMEVREVVEEDAEISRGVVAW